MKSPALLTESLVQAPTEKRTISSYDGASPFGDYGHSGREDSADLTHEPKKMAKYDLAAPFDYENLYYDEPTHARRAYHDEYSDANHQAPPTNDNTVQAPFEQVKVNNEPIVEKQEYLTNVLGENEVLKQRLNYTESMIYTMKGQLDKVMMFLPNNLDTIRLFGYNDANNRIPELAGLQESIMSEVDNFFL